MSFFSRFFSKTAISIVDGRATCAKGKLTQKSLGSISEVCNTFHITKGKIWVSGDGRVHFSASIPKDAHQRLRNCVVQSSYS